MVEYLDLSDDDMINYICEQLEGECTGELLLGQLCDVFDEVAEEFVVKLWKMLIFFQLQGKLG